MQHLQVEIAKKVCKAHTHTPHIKFGVQNASKGKNTNSRTAQCLCSAYICQSKLWCLQVLWTRLTLLHTLLLATRSVETATWGFLATSSLVRFPIPLEQLLARKALQKALQDQSQHILAVPRKALLQARKLRNASRTALAQNFLLATAVSSGCMTQLNSQDLA